MYSKKVLQSSDSEGMPQICVSLSTKMLKCSLAQQVTFMLQGVSLRNINETKHT